MLARLLELERATLRQHFSQRGSVDELHCDELAPFDLLQIEDPADIG